MLENGKSKPLEESCRESRILGSEAEVDVNVEVFVLINLNDKGSSAAGGIGSKNRESIYGRCTIKHMPHIPYIH